MNIEKAFQEIDEIDLLLTSDRHIRLREILKQFEQSISERVWSECTEAYVNISETVLTGMPFVENPYITETDNV